MNRSTRVAAAAILWILRVALAGVFAYAGAMKMRDPQAFAESIASFRLLPRILIDPAALTLPPLEIFAALLTLTVGRWRRAGAFCLLVLLAVFCVALASALARGLTVDCGCFGSGRFDILSPSKNLWVAFGRDMLLILAAGLLYADATRRKTNAPATSNAAGAG